MGRQKERKFHQVNNAGTALITAIVVVAFVTILATTILYVAGRNYYVKVTDLRTKASFYEAETGLEEIKAALAVEVSKASKVAYQYVMEHHAGMDEAALEATFNEKFFEALLANWDTSVRAKVGLNEADPITDGNYLAYIQSCTEALYNVGGNSIKLIGDGSHSLGRIVWDTTMDATGTTVKNNYATLYGVHLEYTSTEGYTTIISTDFVIFPPDINWTFEEEAPDGASPSPEPPSEVKEVDLTQCVQYSNWVKE